MVRLASAFLLLCLAVWQATAQSPEDAIKAIHAKGKELMAAGKAEEAFKLWHDDDVLFIKPCGAIIAGREKVFERYQHKQKTRPKKSYENVIEDILQDDTMPVEISTTTIGYEKNGVDKKKTFKHVVVWKKTGDTYKAIIDAMYHKPRRGRGRGNRVKRQTAREVVEELNKNFSKKVLEGKFKEAMEEAYDANVKMIWGGKSFPDRASFLAATLEHEQRAKMVAFDCTVDKIYEGGDMIVTVGTADMKREKDGEAMATKRTTLNVFRKKDGKYRMVLGTFFNKHEQERGNRVRRESPLIGPEDLLKDTMQKLKALWTADEIDVAKILERYSENAKVINPGGKLVKGKDALKEYFKSKVTDMEATKLTESSVTFTKLISHGDLVAGLAKMHIKYQRGEVSGEKMMQRIIVGKVEDFKVQIEIDGIFHTPKTGGAHAHHGHDHHRVRRETARETLLAQHKVLLKLFNEGKYEEAIKGMYADDASLVTPEGTTVNGLEAIQNHVTKFASMATDISSVIDETMEAPEDKMIVELGLTKFITDKGVEGKEMHHSMRHLAIWEKGDDGKHKLVIDGLFAGDGTHVHPMGRVRRQRDAADEGAKTVEDIHDHLKKHFKEKDIDGLMKHFAESARMIKPDGTIFKGKAAIKKHIEEKFKKPYTLEDIDFGVDTKVEDGNLIAVLGTATMKGKNGDADESFTKKRRRIMVLRKVGEKLLIEVTSAFKHMSASMRMKRDTTRDELTGVHTKAVKQITEGKIAEALKEIYFEDAKLVKPCGCLKTGRDEITADMKRTAGKVTDLSTSIDEIIEDGKLVIELGITKFITDKGGDNEKEHAHRHLAVWKRDDNGLKMKIDSLFAGDGVHKDTMHEMAPSRVRRSATVKDQLQANVDEIFKAWYAKDYPRAGKVYSENAKFIDEKGALHDGRKAIIKKFEDYEEEFPESSESSIAIEQIIEDPTLPVTVGTATYKFEGEDNVHKSTSVMVWRKVGDKYELAVEGIFPGVGSGLNTRRHRRSTGKEMINKAHTDFIKLFKEGKMEDAMKVYASNVIYIEPSGKVLNSREKLTESFKNMITMTGEVKDLKVDVNHVCEAGDTIISTGITRMTTEKAGVERTENMRYISVWKKQENGKYHVALDALFPGDGSQPETTAEPSRVRRRRETSVKDTLQANLNDIVTAWDAGKWDDIGAFYKEDALFIGGTGSVYRGREDIVKKFKKYETDDYEGSTTTFTIDHIVEDDTMPATVAKMVTKMGEHTKKATAVIVWTKVDDDYKILVDGYLSQKKGRNSTSLFTPTRARRHRRSTSKAIIEKLHGDFIKLVKEGKINEAMKVYTEDTINVLPSGRVLTSRAELLESFKKRVTEEPLKDISTEINNVFENDQTFVETGVTTIKIMKNDAEEEKKLRHIAVWKKQDDGSFKVAIDVLFRGDGTQGSGESGSESGSGSSSSESNETD